MADEKEDIVFQLKVENGDALSEMERFKKSILLTKEEQKQLTKALKEGNITLDEFVKEQVRLEAILKKQQSSYNNVQKSVTGVKTQLDKLIDSNKKIAGAFQETAGKINVAGVNIGDLTTKIAAFANPATAAIGIVGALTAIYIKSTAGAKDFAFAQERLSFMTSRAVEAFGTFIGGTGAGGSGPLSKFIDAATNAALNVIPGLNLALGKSVNAFLEESKAAAQAAEILKDLDISMRFAQAFFKEDERRAELQRRIRDDEGKSVAERIAATNQINQILQAAGDRTVIVLQAQIQAIKESTVNYDNNREAQLKVAELEAQISDKREEVTGKLTENTTAIKNMALAQATLNAEAKKYLDNLLKILPLEVDRQNNLKRQELIRMGQKFTEDAAVKEVDTNAAMNKMIQAQNKRTQDQKIIGSKKSVELAQAEADARVQAETMALDALAGLAAQGSEIQKAASLLSIALSGKEAITKGVAASQSVPFPGNLAAMASTIAAILGAISNAKSALGFAEGGWTGPGHKYQPAGVVHADEYVTPKHIVHSAAAQPHLAALESMRLRGYADGGLVTNSLTAETNQSMLIANMMKMMPVPELSVVEVTRVQNKISVKQKATMGKPFQK